MRWPKINELYSTTFRANEAFSSSNEGGVARWGALHKRTIEHNIRVISRYYTQITMTRLTQLLDLAPAETESFLSDLVSKGTIFAKIDRPSGRISFKPATETVEEVLNVWSAQCKSVLDLIGKTGHLISKEEMVARIQKTL